MPNVGQILKEEIRRVARREVRAECDSLKQQVRVLRDTVKAQAKLIASLGKAAASPAAPTARSEAPEEEAPVRRRWTPASIKRQRARLKLSQREFSDVLKVSANTVARWETGTSSPRPTHRTNLDKLRGMGIRAVRKMLGGEG